MNFACAGTTVWSPESCCFVGFATDSSNWKQSCELTLLSLLLEWSGDGRSFSSQYAVVNRKAEPSVLGTLVMDLTLLKLVIHKVMALQGRSSFNYTFTTKMSTWLIPWMNTCIGFTWRSDNIHLYVWTDVGVLLLCKQFGMGTAEWRASKKSSYYDRISYIPGIKVWSSFIMFPLYITQPNLISI